MLVGSKGQAAVTIHLVYYSEARADLYAKANSALKTVFGVLYIDTFGSPASKSPPAAPDS
jgi:hypothetical protein